MLRHFAQNFDLLRPFTGLSEAELKDVASSGYFVAGFTGSAQLSLHSLRDAMCVFSTGPVLCVSFRCACSRVFVYADPACADKKDMYDLLVNVAERKFTVPDHAKDSFIMTKFHKSTAEAFVKASEAGAWSLLLYARTRAWMSVVTIGCFGPAWCL